MIIVDRSPIFEEPTHVSVGGERVLIRPYQAVVWVSITLDGFESARIPAVLDTGFSLNFSINEEHLASWAGIELASLRRIGRTRVNQRDCFLYAAGVAVQRNRRDERDEFSGASSYRLTFREGIVVYPRGEQMAPRLPLLGTRAISSNRLQTIVDGSRNRLTIKTRHWLFGRS